GGAVARADQDVRFAGAGMPLDDDREVLGPAAEIERAGRPVDGDQAAGAGAKVGVAAAAAADLIVAGAAVDHVIAGAAVDLVGALAAGDRVIAGAARDGVVADAAVDQIGAIAACNVVVARVPEEFHGLGVLGAFDRVVAVAAVNFNVDIVVIDSGEVEQVIAGAAHADDLGDAGELLGIILVAAKLRRPDLDRAA